jgi:hypothetical protein
LSEKGVDYNGLHELIVQEQFLDTCPKDLATFLEEQKQQTLNDLIEAADRYLKAHDKTFRPPKKHLQRDGHQEDDNRTEPTPHNDVKKGCFVCDALGHKAVDCPEVKRIRQARSKNSQRQGCGGCSAYTMATERIQTGVEFDKDDWETSSLQDEDDERDPVTVGYVEGREVSVLRDMGAINCSLVRKDLVPPGKFTGKTKWLRFADTEKRTEVPMAKVQVDTPYFRGELEAACVNSSMFDLMIGNVKAARKPDDPDPEWRRTLIQQEAEEEDPLPCAESRGEDDTHGGVVCQPDAMLESVAAEEEDPLPEADIVDRFHGGASGESMPCGDRVTLCQPREVTRTATKGEQLLRDDGGDNGLSMAPTGSQQSDNGASEGPQRRLVMCSAFALLPVATDVQGAQRHHDRTWVRSTEGSPQRIFRGDRRR